MVEAIVYVGGEVHSCGRAAILLKRLQMDVCCKTVQRVIADVGDELISRRENDRLAGETIAMPPQVAVVQCDGGRILTREPGCGPGVHQQAWKETKNAGLFRMTSEIATDDPHPELPSAFADRARLAKLTETAAPDDIDETPEKQGCNDDPLDVLDKPPSDKYRPRVLVRTVVSSMANSETFGRQMKQEARHRRFDESARRAFVGDGLPCNWTIHREHFSDYVPILDFIHVAGYLFAAASVIEKAKDESWSLYLRLATACWQGRVDQVIAALSRWLADHDLADTTSVDPDHPFAAVVTALRYLRCNRERMDYPSYRRSGLPVTSSLMESLVKQVNLRVKGTDQFWDRPRGAERILQIRAAILSDDDRLARHLTTRPGSPYIRRRKQTAANT